MTDRSQLLAQYHHTRARTEALAAPLSPEDQQLQAMPSASPVKWHRAHTTWFFETFVLAPHGIAPREPRWGALFNSYYEAVGPRHPRPERGLLSRPSASQIATWRRVVDEQVGSLLETVDDAAFAALAPVVTLGIAHEQQHQELILTDVLAALDRNPLRPAYRPLPTLSARRPIEAGWVTHDGGVVSIGHPAGGGDPSRFAFDNEGPAHRVFLQPFQLATRLVTVGEWSAFARDGGYTTPSLWLSDGLDLVRSRGIDAPAYTRREGDAVVVYGLHGERLAAPDEPVVHLSFYEADALATWLGGRLPTEAEWEAVAAGTADDRREPAAFVVVPLAGDDPNLGWYDTAWQWTRSTYAPYPGYRPAAGALGEYNGKFMVNQQVLRGGSVFTPPGHSRPTYRNFWPPDTRFQVSGLRLARDL